MSFTLYRWDGTALRLLLGAGGDYTPPHDDGLVVGSGAQTVGTATYTVPSDGTARYVSTTGSNGNNGLTPSTPWATFEYAAANTPAGGTIVMRGGTYHEGKVFTGTANNNTKAYVAISIGNANVTVQNYPGEEVWFDGSSVYTGWSADGSWWSRSWTPLRRDVYEWESSYPPAVDDNNTTNGWGSYDSTQTGWTYVDYSDTTRACAARPERVWVDGVQLTQVVKLADMGAGKFFADPYTNKMYIGTNPAGKTVRITDLQTLLNSLGTGFTMRGVGVRRYGNSLPQFGVVKFHRANATVENCVFEDLSGKGVSVVGASNNTGANNISFNHCTFRRCGNTGLHVDQIDNLATTDCRYEYCNDKLFNPAPDAGAMKITKVRGYTGTRNLYFNTYRGKGIWTDIDVQDITEINSDFINIEQRASVFEMSRNIKVIGCRFKGIGAEAIVFMDSEDKEVWNCVFYDTGIRRGQVMGADTINGTGIANYTDNRSPRESAFAYAQQGTRDQRIPTYLAWGGANPGGYWTSKVKVRNTIFGPSNYQAYWRDQILGSDNTGSGSGDQSIVRSWAADGLNFNRNYYNGHSSKQGSSRQYPFVLRTATSTTSNSIYSTPSALAAATTSNPAGALEANGVEYTDVDRCDPTTGLLQAGYQAAADAIAEAIPSDIAALMGIPTGTKLMGPRPRSV